MIIIQMFASILKQERIGRKKYALVTTAIFFSYPLQLILFVGLYYMLQSIIPYDLVRVFVVAHPLILTLALIPLHNRRLTDLGYGKSVTFFIALFQIAFYIIFGLAASIFAQSEYRITLMNIGIIIFLISIIMMLYLIFKKGKHNTLNI